MDPRCFTFEAGQWVDFWAPGIRKAVGGERGAWGPARGRKREARGARGRMRGARGGAKRCSSNACTTLTTQPLQASPLCRRPLSWRRLGCLTWASRRRATRWRSGLHSRRSRAPRWGGCVRGAACGGAGVLLHGSRQQDQQWRHAAGRGSSSLAVSLPAAADGCASRQPPTRLATSIALKSRLPGARARRGHLWAAPLQPGAWQPLTLRRGRHRCAGLLAALGR